MSDEELCKALRSALWGQGHHINIKAADRIEQLVKERDVSNELGKALEEDAGQLRDKLAKAVEALRFYSPQTVGGITFVGGDDAGKRAAAVLAELEEQK
jgi:hypothetical protein